MIFAVVFRLWPRYRGYRAIRSRRDIPAIRRARSAESPSGKDRRPLLLESGAPFCCVRCCKTDRLKVAFVFDRLFKRHRDCGLEIELGVSAAIGAREAMTSAMARARGRSCADGRTSPTSPPLQCLVGRYGIAGHQHQCGIGSADGMEKVRRHPTTADPAALDLGAANWALSEAMRISQDMAVSRPPPNA